MLRASIVWRDYLAHAASGSRATDRSRNSTTVKRLADLSFSHQCDILSLRCVCFPCQHQNSFKGLGFVDQGHCHSHPGADAETVVTQTFHQSSDICARSHMEAWFQVPRRTTPMHPVSVKAARSWCFVRIDLSLVISAARACDPSATFWMSGTSSVPLPTRSSACSTSSGSAEPAVSAWAMSLTACATTRGVFSSKTSLTRREAAPRRRQV